MLLPTRGCYTHTLTAGTSATAGAYGTDGTSGTAGTAKLYNG